MTSFSILYMPIPSLHRGHTRAIECVAPRMIARRQKVTRDRYGVGDACKRDVQDLGCFPLLEMSKKIKKIGQVFLEIWFLKIKVVMARRKIKTATYKIIKKNCDTYNACAFFKN